jgi:hypothetical protein
MEFRIMIPAHRRKHICKPLQADPQTKVCKRTSTPPAQEKLFFKTSLPSKNFKTATTHTGRKTFGQLIAKLNIDKGCETRTTKIAICQYCIKATPGEVVNSRIVQVIHYGSNRTGNRLKSASALILATTGISFKTTPILLHPRGFSARHAMRDKVP